MTKIYKVLFPIGVFATLMISSCELYNPAEPIPAYIHIQKIDLNTTYADEGSNSSKISDAWVYIDDQLMGCFELPVTFPVIAEGVHAIKIKAGIKVNGIAANRAPYPFYSNYEQTINLKVGTTTTLSPTVYYLSSTTFAYKEDFEGGGVTIARTANSDTTLQILTSPDPNVFEGLKSGITYLDVTRTKFEFSTVANYDLPKAGASVFLEFNYKCNYPFTISIIAYGTATAYQYSVLHLNPSSSWNKVYVHLTPAVSGAYTAVDYKIVWGTVNNTSQDSVAVLLDNIKLVY